MLRFAISLLILVPISLIRIHVHTTCVVQDPSVTAATSAQPGAGQDDYNPFVDDACGFSLSFSSKVSTLSSMPLKYLSSEQRK